MASILAFVLVALALSADHASCYMFGPSPCAAARRSTRRSFVTMSSLAKPRGCAATPLQKKSVAVFGAGGYLGGTIFGFCQRASNLYGTGIGGPSVPRSITATAEGSLSLNKVLSKGFKLAYAGEQMVRLTNMKDIEHITGRVKGMDAVFIGTVNQQETRAVTGNTYESSPNDKAAEFYLDERKVVGMGELSADIDTHLALFQNAISACKDAGVKHLVVIETPNTPSAEPFAKILDNAGLPFTYIYTKKGCKWDYSKDWTFEKGLKGTLSFERATLADNFLSKSGYEAGDWADSLSTSSAETDAGDVVYREDIGALAVQSLMSLDWTRSRCIEISSKGGQNNGGDGDDAADKKFRPSRPPRSDREWCVRSNELAQMLAAVE